MYIKFGENWTRNSGVPGGGEGNGLPQAALL